MHISCDLYTRCLVKTKEVARLCRFPQRAAAPAFRQHRPPRQVLRVSIHQRASVSRASPRRMQDGQAQALAAVALGISQLMEFPEGPLLLGLRDAGALVPDLDAQAVRDASLDLLPRRDDT